MAGADDIKVRGFFANFRNRMFIGLLEIRGTATVAEGRSRVHRNQFLTTNAPIDTEEDRVSGDLRFHGGSDHDQSIVEAP